MLITSRRVGCGDLLLYRRYQHRLPLICYPGLNQVDVGGVRVGVIICYDIRIPELCRSLVLEHGVHLIFHGGAYFRDESFPSWPAFAVTRAMENQVFLPSLNRAGVHYGASMFCRPWGREMNEIFLFPEHDEACRYLTVDLAYLREVRRNYSFLADRLETYG